MAVFFPNKTFQIHRLRRITNTNRFAVSATYTAYEADIQPASRDRTEMAEGRFGKVYSAYVDSSIVIREGDFVVTSDGTKYGVKGVSTWSGAGLLDGHELLLVAQD